MSEEMIIGLVYETIKIILVISAPMLISGLLVGLLVAVFQATTQIQEPTLAFVPKIAIVFLVMMLLSPWIIQSLIEYTHFVMDFVDQLVV